MSPPLRMALAGAAIVLISAGMHAIQDILAPFLFAIITAICVAPLFYKLVHKGVHKVLAAIISLVVVMAIFISIALILLVSVDNMASEMPEQLAGVDQSNSDLANDLASLGIDVDNTLTRAFNSSNVTEAATNLLNQLSSLIAFSVLMILFVLYMIFDLDAIRNVFYKLFGDPSANLKYFTGFANNITSYVFTQTWTGAIVGLLDALFLYWYGIPYAGLWGLLSFFMGFIPNIGFWIALIPPAILAYSIYGWQGVLVVVIAFNLINGTMEIFIKPRVIGKSVSVSTTVVFLSLTYWGFVLGPWGGLLAIPLTLMVKNLMLDVFPGTRSLSALISLNIEDAAQAGALPAADADSPTGDNPA